jgi:UDP-N-acetylmuramoylalanine--D-glutamate ligase
MTGDQEFLVGKRVTVLGLGIEGVDLVRYLAAKGAHVTISDSRPKDSLISRIRELHGIQVEFSLGENRLDAVTGADLLFVSQGVPLALPSIEAAREHGVEISSMTRLFFERCAGITIGITGSSGKTTTTALLGSMLEAAGRKHVVGGNIGVGMLGLLDDITPDTLVVLELSHTQLETAGHSPHIACVLNVTPNHLDRYSWPEYSALKLRILEHQNQDDIAVLNLDDEVASSFVTEAPGQVFWYSAKREPTGDAAFLRNSEVVWRRGGVETKLFSVDEIPLRGPHNISNVLAAVALGCVSGTEFEAVSRAVREFQPVEHRIELVSEFGGVAYYNDSIATTPERTLAGLRSFDEPVVLLLGGRGKNLPLEDLAEEAMARCRAVICFGEAGPELEQALLAARGEANIPAVQRVDSLSRAVEAARHAAQPGDVVLLSPSCTSYDAYENFEQRGQDFRDHVRLFAAKEPA